MVYYWYKGTNIPKKQFYSFPNTVDIDHYSLELNLYILLYKFHLLVQAVSFSFTQGIPNFCVNQILNLNSLFKIVEHPTSFNHCKISLGHQFLEPFRILTECRVFLSLLKA